MSTPNPNAGQRPARDKDDPGWAPESGDKPDAAQPLQPEPKEPENEPRRSTPGAPSRGTSR